MAYDRFASWLMGMNDEIWKRHANPWSGWTRLGTFPLWFVAIWSWTWIGWWSILPVFILAIWTWLNPRVFRPFKSDQSWMTRGVLGEHIFINRRKVPIPESYVLFGHILNILALIAVIGAIIGFVNKEFWLALGGWLLTVTLKMWFVDRMAWLYEIMKDEFPEHLEWPAQDSSTDLRT